jgi:DNA polymerase-1
MHPSSCILIDGSSFFYRAFHALPPLVNSKGQPTGAIYGVANMVKKIMAQYQPQYIAVIFDAPGKTFRDEIYPEYKAHRAPTPEDLKSQYQPLVQLLEAMGIQVYAVSGVEADDVIGTLAQQAIDKNIPVCIATGDKDFAQIVNSHVCLYNSMSEQWLDEAGIEAKYGIKPKQFIDYLTLTGDSVDNIPGVPKCGPKTATKWLQTYETLDNLVEHAQEITGKIGENLRNSIPQFPLSKKLVTIDCHLDLPFSLDSLHPLPENTESLYEIVSHLEFKTWMKKVEFQTQSASEKPITPSTPKATQIIAEISELKNWLDKHVAIDTLLVIDLETTSLDTLTAEIVGISLCTDADHSIYIPVAHHTGMNCPIQDTLNLLKPYFENPKQALLGQNLKYDMNVLKKYHIHLQGIQSDTMLESYVLNSASNRHDLGTLAKTYLHQDSISYEDLTGKGAKQIPFADVAIEKAAQYSGEDVQLTYLLHGYFQDKLNEKEQKLLHDIEIPLETVLADMEYTGVAINVELLQQQSEVLKQRLADLEQNAWNLAGSTFNLQSPKQLAEIFYNQMQLPVLERTPSGQPSTAEEVLISLAQQYELPALILEHRRLSKLVSTYLDALPKKVHPLTGRVHTSYNQAVTATGRLSSSDPNLQNIPIRTNEGKIIRQAFIAKPNYRLVTADYSQVELRIMAHLSEDPLLIKAFHNNHDIHQATASEIFGVAMDEVTPEQRRQAKAINFGLIYGMSAFGLAKQLDISRGEAQNYINRYFERYQGVLGYMDKIRALAKQQGYVETIFGRRLYLPEIQSKNIARQKAAERIAINAPMQGTAADIIKKAMNNLHHWLRNQNQIRGDMIMQVHDELIFEIHEDDVKAFMPHLQNMMEHAVSLKVPLLVNMGSGLNWDEAH